MARVFINYRREDASGAAGRLHDHLAKAIPRSDLFMDADAMRPGIDFVTQIEQQVAKCDVLLAIIGRHWLGSGPQGANRLHEPRDFVRAEIATALRRGIPVVPVLIDGAPMPDEDLLPDDVKPLARRHAMELRHTRFAADADAIVAAVGGRAKSRLPVSARVAAALAILIAAGASAALLAQRYSYFETPRTAAPASPQPDTHASAAARQLAAIQKRLEAQRGSDAPKSATAASIQSLTVKLGDSYDVVRKAYPAAAETGSGDLSLPFDGIRFFFSKDSRVLNNIRTDAPFIGTVHGIHISDRVDDIIAKLGQPSYVRGSSHFFRLDGDLVRFDLDASNQVETIFQLLDKSAAPNATRTP